jgi:hypothetical protein
MKKMFSSMMAGFAKGMPKEDKKKMMDFGEKMVGMCSCMPGKEMTDDQGVTFGEGKKAMAERMSCCGGAKEMMSSFFKKASSQSDEAAKSEKA